MVCTRRICTIYAVALPARKIFRNDEDENDVVTRIYIYIYGVYICYPITVFSFRVPLREIFIKKIIIPSFREETFAFVGYVVRVEQNRPIDLRRMNFVRSSWIDFDRNATLHIFRSLSRDIYIYKYTSSNTFRWYIYIHCVNFDLVIRSRVQNEPIRKIIYIVYDLCYKTFSPVPRWPIIFFQE